MTHFREVEQTPRWTEILHGVQRARRGSHVVSPSARMHWPGTLIGMLTIAPYANAARALTASLALAQQHELHRRLQRTDPANPS